MQYLSQFQRNREYMMGEIKSWLLQKIVPDEVFLGATFLVISLNLIVYKRGWIHKL